jgi:hypothetical protein
MNEVLESQACQNCKQAVGTRTLYVHLCSGRVEAVQGVSDVEVTQLEIILLRGPAAPAVFPRRSVFYTCCDVDASPSF